MVCAQCGGVLEAEARFCARCGAPVVTRATPVGGVAGGVSGGGFSRPDPRFGGPPPVGYGAGAWVGMRVRRNLRTMGVLWCCFGVYRLVAGLAELIFLRKLVRGDGFGNGFPFGPGFHMPQIPWMADFLPMIVVGVVASAALAIATGIALLNRASWARVLAVIAAVLALIKFPLGTALGIYTLYVLAPRMSGVEWDEMTGSQPVK